MSTTYEVSSLSTSSSPPPYTEDLHSDQRRFTLEPKNDDVSDIGSPSPTEPIQVARYSQTLNTLFHSDYDLPEVVTAQHKETNTNPSEGLIPVESESEITVSSTTRTVTPLHLLGDQPDTVDCPFCCRRVETRIKKEASYVTHITATTLFFTTFAGAVAPYAKHWTSNISHHCTNCDRKVAYRRYGKKETVALGTPEHLKVVSKFPAAVSRENLQNA